MRFAAIFLTVLLLGTNLVAEAIPTIDTSALDGTPVHLPNAGDGRPAVLVLGFSRRSSEQAVQWGKRLYDAPWNDRHADSYEIAMLGDVPGFLRGMVLRSMRKNIPPVAQSTLVPLYSGEDRWREAAQVDSVDEVYLLVVDRDGAIRWRGKGEYSEQLMQQVTRQIAQLKK